MVGQLGRVVLLSETHEFSLIHILARSEPQADLYNLTLGGYFMVVQGGLRLHRQPMVTQDYLPSSLEPCSVTTVPQFPAIQLMMQLALYKQL